MKMTTERAIEILNPEHREHYDSIETVNEACRMGMEALKRTRWISVGKRKPDDGAVVIAASRHNIAGHTFWDKCVACWDSDAATFYLIDCDKCFTGEYWMQLPEVEP